MAHAVEHMREQLEGKAYVERYVQTLTHELKSPLAAIRGAAELLKGDMPDAQRQHFASNIESESMRLHQLIDRLLHLAAVEQRQHLEDVGVIPLQQLVQELLAAQAGRIAQVGLRTDVDIDAPICVRGEPFLIRQAIANLLDNALDFAAPRGLLRIAATTTAGSIELHIYNEGDPIPDFALSRLTERFYSLPRPVTGRKSTGLGLNFVQEVVNLHRGALAINNRERGVEVTLTLPAA